MTRTGLALAALITGTLLAPLNSSMVAVALTPIGREFGLPLGTATWVVTVFYLTACVCQPVLGRVADRIGPRRLFTAGLTVAAVASAAAATAGSVPALILCRGLQAAGVAAAFPCAVLVIRRGTGELGTARLAAVATANTTAGAVGPVLGGLLTAWAGWQAVFWVNLPLMLGALLLAWRAIGPDEPRPRTGGAIRALDPAGVLLFAAAVVGLLDLMLGFSWPAAALFAVATTGFLWWERRAATPFVDVRALAATPGLVAVLATFLLFNLAYYGAFYGLPPWLQTTLGYDAAQAGLLVMPIAATSVVATVLGGPVTRRLGVGRALLFAGALLPVGVSALATFGPSTPAWLIVLDGIVLGIPYGLCNLGLQRLMYERAPEQMSGVVAGLFQSTRYVGAILAVGVVGATAPRSPGSPPDLRVLAIAMTAVAALMLCSLRLVDGSRSKPGLLPRVL
ncbi:MFS transporter [Amycolatopsis sp. EV170708-02-1]|uniref:MFS transporter n=1 Tax=Amycolatopsis sp. EV170708-02-1 TaxID=2919322 RepID=UPI001F0BA238|nr:MFS transporter [Amycolatopsis sp. EV170708-02-1]UMP06903.1 MFS transporter [Amycolatopsis sp. EV170708-02-1]